MLFIKTGGETGAQLVIHLNSKSMETNTCDLVVFIPIDRLGLLAYLVHSMRKGKKKR